MKIRNTRRQTARGIMLVECVTYIAVLAVIFALGYGAYFRALDSTRALQRNANDIARALNAGEQWRNDVRLAKSISATNNVLKITQPSGQVEYVFENGSIWRQSGAKPRAQLLVSVKSSQMIPDPRQEVTAWRWELELQTRQTTSKIKPLFSFQGVSARPQSPTQKPS